MSACRGAWVGNEGEVPSDLRFRDRDAAGRALAERLAAFALPDPIVLALPRGGVPVAAKVAAALGASLDVFVVRKIGAPTQPEFGVGAIAEGGDALLDEAVLTRLMLTAEDLAATIRREREELARRVTRYRHDRPLPSVTGRNVVLVDDGLATGVSARAALRELRHRGPGRLVLAVPVCAADAADGLGPDVDDLVCVRTPEPFRAVGVWYERFEQVTDEQVVALLDAAAG